MKPSPSVLPTLQAAVAPALGVDAGPAPVLPPSCKGCGACCKSYPYIDVDWGDAVPRRLTALAREYGCLHMKRVKWACIALDRRRRTCTIYPVRPRVCRQVKRGGPLCIHALRFIPWRRRRGG